MSIPHPRRLGALALALLLMPAALLAPSAMAFDPNPPKGVCHGDVCVEVVFQDIFGYIVGPEENGDLLTETVYAVRGQFRLDVDQDHLIALGAIVRDETPFQFNGSAGLVKYGWTQTAGLKAFEVTVHDYDVDNIGEIWRVNVVVRQGDDVLFSAPARWVHLYDIESVEIADTGSVVDFGRGFMEKESAPASF